MQIPDFEVSSAGTHAVIGHPIHQDAALVLEGLGGDASNFAARQLTSRIASNVDLILTMTKAHRHSVLELAPSRLHQTFTLLEAARLINEYHARDVSELAAFRSQLLPGEMTDIPDPIGRGAEFFAQTGSRIAELIPSIANLCRRG